MHHAITVVDETLSGERVHAFTLETLTESMTVRELIRARIYQEVDDYNRTQPEDFRGLVDPRGAERVLNGMRLTKRRLIDWEDQYEKACTAFERNGFFILIGDRQAEELDETFEVKVDTEVSFVKLVPLVGG